MSLFSRQKQYDIIYSLGSTCAAATYLNRHFLRIQAGPFDWCGNETRHEEFKWRERLIRSHFAGFMQKENLEFIDGVPGISPDPNCEFCRDRVYPLFLMPHDFPVGVPMEESYPRVKAKYDRRIGRFYQNIAASERVLLVYLTLKETGCDHTVIKRTCEGICAEFGKSVDFLLLWHHDGMAPDQAPEQEQLAPNITLWRGFFRSAPEGKEQNYQGNRKKLDPIFREYSLKGTRWTAFKARSRKLLGRVLSSFIPVSSWRKKVRRHFIDSEFNRAFIRRN